MQKLITSVTKTLLAALFAITLLAQPLAVQADQGSNCKGTQALQIGETGLTAEIAATDKSRQYGLMFRRSMGADCGMLFVFPGSRARTFTMRNTLIPLDIAFIDEEGVIREIFTMQPGVNAYPSRVRARYALEVNAGWFESNGIGVDSLIELSSNEELKPLTALQ